VVRRIDDRDRRAQAPDPEAMSVSASEPRLEGELRFDEAARRVASDDFGHIVHRTPTGVLLPASADDVAATIHWAAARGSAFAARGQGHSTFGRSQVEDGIVGALTRLRGIGTLERDQVVVGAGAKWSDVVAVTLAHGRTPPVLTEYLELSVGGTLVVGGVGPMTSTFGVQSDNVIQLEVVTGTGEKLTCSAEHNVDLFDAVRAGLGQAAVITSATLRLVPAPASVRRFLLFYADLERLLRDARLLCAEGRFDAMQGAILPSPSGGLAFRLDAAKHFDGQRPDDAALLTGLSDDPTRREPTTLSYFDYLNRLAALEAALRANRQWSFPHPWLMTFVGDSQVESVVEAELRALDPVADLGELGQIALSPIRSSAISTPLLRKPSDELIYALNFVRITATDDAGEANRLVASNTAAYERIRAAGGTLYPVSALPLSQREWRDHLGPAFAGLEAAKRKFDPNHTLTPGYEIF
jgi:cytokinin dehydrogenase